MMGWWDQGNGFAYAAMSFGMIAFVALFVWALVAVGRGDTRRGDRVAAGPSGSGAERILDERFARGEIDADEYHSRLADLHHPRLADTRS